MLGLLMSGLAACADFGREESLLIPTPAKVIRGDGVLDLSHGVTVRTADTLLRPAGDLLSECMEQEGFHITGSGAGSVPITLGLDPTLPAAGYRLRVLRNGVELCGGSYEGVISATSTLRQLLWSADAQRLHRVEIVDEPRFGWRGVEIIPEIDFPGHSLAALRARPELSCDGQGGAWGKNFSTPLCLGNDATLEFCRNVLTEILEIFPSPYVHIGGDEVEQTAWEHCPRCRQRVADLGLTGIEELQPWFTRELECFLQEHGRILVGWDEVAHDGLSPQSRVMWWRNWNPGTLNDALQQGQHVIISSSEFYYFSGAQDRNSLAKVYGYEPVPNGMPGYDRLIDGVQGHLWSEEAPTKEAVGVRLFPRLLALAETAWCRPDRKDFGRFEQRLPYHLKELSRSGWSYRLPDIGGVCDRNVFVGRTLVRLGVPEGATLYYTLDGSIPDTGAIRYTAPFTVDKDCKLRMRCYDVRGVEGDLADALFEGMNFLSAVNPEGTLVEGLLVRWFDFRGSCCADIDKAPLKEDFISREISIPENVVGDIGLIFDGYIEIPDDGIYSFYTYSDDGSMLRIGGRLVVDNDGLHSRSERSGQIALQRGLHPIELRYFDTNGGVLEAGMIDREGRRIPFTAGMFRH